MIADTSDIHGFSLVQLGHADDLTSVAADLQAATVAADAFGAVGARFLTALNQALMQEADHARRLAERFATARSTADAAADAYRAAEELAVQSISLREG